MDIEKLIEQLKSAAGGPEGIKMCHAAATALSTLQIENQALRNAASGFKAENEKLRAELEQVKQERDVAIEQLHGHCPACAHYTPNHNEGLCRFCCFEIAQDTNVEINDNWKWRGPKEE